MSNTPKLAPLMTYQEIMLERPRLIRSTNSTEHTRAALNYNTPSPLTSPKLLIPVLTRENERRQLTAEEIAEIAKKLW